MAEMNRRQAMSLGAAAIAIAAVPNIPFTAPVVAAPLEPAWIVGTPGEFDWVFTRATSEAQAKVEWLWVNHGVNKCEKNGEPECDCDYCAHFDGIDANRFKSWDDKPGEPTPGDWLRAGFGHICDRCGSETHEECGYAIEDNAVCEDCMELDDWKIANPERHAEMLADLADEEDQPQPIKSFA